jgi:hypothetical protein
MVWLIIGVVLVICGSVGLVLKIQDIKERESQVDRSQVDRKV